MTDTDEALRRIKRDMNALVFQSALLCSLYCSKWAIAEYCANSRERQAGSREVAATVATDIRPKGNNI